MIVVKKFICDVFSENCYVVFDNNSKDGLVIDPGSNFDDVMECIKNNNLNVNAVLLTHGHFDHIYSCKKLQLLGYKIYISIFDATMCNDDNLNCSASNNCAVEHFCPDVLIDENLQNLTFGTINVTVLHTPGHSKGGMSYVIERNIFSGDTIFEHGYGRTDLAGGNFREILTSIKLLLKYTKSDYKLYSGHDI